MPLRFTLSRIPVLLSIFCLIFPLGSLSLLPSSSLILILSLLHNNVTLVFYHAYDNKLVTFAFGEYTPHFLKKMVVVWSRVILKFLDVAYQAGYVVV